jgi:hypothetical protein
VNIRPGEFLVHTVWPAGIYNEPISIIFATNKSATIFYTLDGSLPTWEDEIYSEPIYIDKTTMVKYFGVSKDGKRVTPVQSDIYVIL